MSHPRARRSAARALVASLGVLVALLVAPWSTGPVGAAGACPPPSPGHVRVAVIVDHGDGRPVDAACVVLDDARPTGLDALAAYAASRGGLRFHPSGLLCAIGGHPTSGCGETVGGDYLYWSYWTGDAGAWSYASFGPSRRVADGAVEGWRFQQGAGNASDPPPALAPTAVGFPAAAPTTTAPPAPPPTVTTAPSTPPPGAPTPGEAGAPPAPAGGGATTGAAADPAGPDGAVDGGVAAGDDPASTPAPGDADGTPDADADADADVDGDGAAAVDGAAVDVEVIDAEQAAAAAPATGAGGPPVGALVGALLVVGLGAGAVVRWRQGAA